MAEDPLRKRGLPAIEQARENRGKIRWPPAKYWGYAALILGVSAILHWKRTQGEEEHARQQLMAKQRAVAAEFGPKWTPLRDKIEGWTLDLAKSAGDEVVDRDALKGWDFRDKAGLYLRLRVDDAKDADAIRARARDSLRDAFTSCLMRVPNPNPLAGMDCKRTRDCPHGEFCNEVDHCSRPAQPFNLRVAYRTLRVLSDEWVREVQDASSDLRLRVLEGSFDDATQDDMPLAAELLTRAHYFLVVLDETPAGIADAGAESIQAVAHTARIGVWRLADGKPVLRLRREAGGALLGGTPSVEEDVMAARQRQANSCALALSVRQAMGDTNASAMPPSP